MYLYVSFQGVEDDYVDSHKNGDDTCLNAVAEKEWEMIIDLKGKSRGVRS